LAGEYPIANRACNATGEGRKKHQIARTERKHQIKSTKLQTNLKFKGRKSYTPPLVGGPLVLNLKSEI
jgi:hypothetical protein